MDFSSPAYLADSGRRIDRLRRIINGRTVAILAAGPSIAKLEERIEELAGLDICYFGFNSFIQEKYILSKINKRLSVYMDSCRENLPITFDNIITYLNRNDDNIFISSFWRDAYELVGGDTTIRRLIDSYDEKLLFFTLSYNRTVPNRRCPLHFISGNSLQIAVQIATMGGAARIILFGADGSCKSFDTLHYRSDEYHKTPLGETVLNFDKSLSFNPVLPIGLRNTYHNYNLPQIEILNCSPDSKYTPFPVISYDDAFNIMLAKSAFDLRSDLRIPKLTVISTGIDVHNVSCVMKNIRSQSYANVEHLLLYDGDNFSMPDHGKYPSLRTISHTGDSGFESVRRAVAEAHGDYVAICPATDCYANPDWLNICVEILDNHENYSLVWGLVQHISEHNGAPGYIRNSSFLFKPPPQGAAFKDYWQAKRLIFPQSTVCVRKHVFERCFVSAEYDISEENEAWWVFTHNFISGGFEPFFVPLIACFHRTFFDQGGHRPEGDPITMHLPYYAPLVKEALDDPVLMPPVKKPSPVKPHVLIVSEKWCDCSPEFGTTNSEHNIWGSLAASNLATFDLLHFDEHHYYGRGNPDAALLDLYKSKRPDLVFISWLATTDRRANPSFRTLDIIKSLGTPVVAIFWDSANPANMDIAESVAPHVNLILLADSTTAYLESAKRADKYLPIWCPQDTSIFNNPHYSRDIDVCFLGSINTHPERSRAISALMSSNIKVHVGGGQREQPVPVKQYADMFKRSKIVLNFSRHAYGYYQHKGRVFEATLCGALLLESENPETEKWLIPMRDYVPFKDEADLVDKVTYFLAHESERQRIANNGCSKATEKYTGETFWRTILSRLVFLS